MQLRIADRLMAVVLAASVAGIASAHEVAATRADFVPPPVGSYRLERILEAPDAKLVDSAGASSRRPTRSWSIPRAGRSRSRS